MGKLFTVITIISATLLVIFVYILQDYTLVSMDCTYKLLLESEMELFEPIEYYTDKRDMIISEVVSNHSDDSNQIEGSESLMESRQSILPDIDGFSKDEYGNYIITVEQFESNELPYLEGSDKLEYLFYYDESGEVLNPMPEHYKDYMHLFAEFGG